jgi:ABC-type branched-subunit amino acid transport system substrate-binding protein
LGKLGVTGAALVIVLAACGNNASSGSSGGPIKIGVTGPFTGSYAAPGIDIQNAAKVMADEFNKSGGIMGRQVQVVPGDDQCDAQVGVQAAENLVSQGVVAFAGGYCSGASIPETDVLRRHSNIPFVAVASSNPQLTEQGYKNVFRLIERDDAAGPFDANFLIKVDKAKRVAIMHDNSTYAKALAQFAQGEVTKEGGTVTYFDAITPGQKDYTSALTRVASTNPDAFYFTGYYAEAAILVKEYKDLGLDKKFVFHGGGAEYDPAYTSAAGPAADGTTVIFPVGPDTAKGKEFDSFKAAYKSATGKDLATYSIYEHDAMWLLKLAIERAHSTKPADIDTALHQVSYNGITGPIKFNSKGDRVQQALVVFRVENDQFVPIYRQQGSTWVKSS